ncbi:unnamed protein product [Moneuplotes crassus]|uniref:Uncharacterized protein n=1 Tax=Euplotes crassus TaxID=5936 RepID=A0AAD1Y348_EUPCR|nr:unnamed protein product [Moneuplotes crassus]
MINLLSVKEENEDQKNVAFDTYQAVELPKKKPRESSLNNSPTDKIISPDRSQRNPSVRKKRLQNSGYLARKIKTANANLKVPKDGRSGTMHTKNNLQNKIQGKAFSPKGPLGSARIGDPSNDFSSATNQAKTKRSKLFNGVLNPEKEQKINLENKIKFYYGDYNKEILMNDHMNFDETDQIEKEVPQCKWKIFTDLICGTSKTGNFNKLMNFNQFREILKKINQRIFTDPKLIAKLVFRDKKGVKSKGILKMKNMLKDMTQRKKDKSQNSSSIRLKKVNKKLKSPTHGMIPSISLLSKSEKGTDENKRLLVEGRVKLHLNKDISNQTGSLTMKNRKDKKNKHFKIKAKVKQNKGRDSFTTVMEQISKRSSSPRISRVKRLSQMPNDETKRLQESNGQRRRKTQVLTCHSGIIRPLKSPKKISRGKILSADRKLSKERAEQKRRYLTYYNKRYRPSTARQTRNFRKQMNQTQESNEFMNLLKQLKHFQESIEKSEILDKNLESEELRGRLKKLQPNKEPSNTSLLFYPTKDLAQPCGEDLQESRNISPKDRSYNESLISQIKRAYKPIEQKYVNSSC